MPLSLYVAFILAATLLMLAPSLPVGRAFAIGSLAEYSSPPVRRLPSREKSNAFH
jgi:hypothetical protein